MKELYTIGEVAKLFNVSTDTFRFYEKIGLIKPWEKGANGYRYYHRAQFEMISTIIFLKSVGTPLEHLPEIIHHKNTDKIQEELLLQQRAIEKKIALLRYQKKRIIRRYNNIVDVSKPQEIVIEKAPTLWMLSKEIDREDDLFDFDDVSMTHYATDKKWLSTANVFSSITPKEMNRREYHSYKRYGYISEYPCNTGSSELVILKDQLCAMVSAVSGRADLRDLDPLYDRLRSHIEKEGYRISGEVIERNVVDLFQKDEKSFTHYFKIYIPIEPKGSKNPVT